MKTALITGSSGAIGEATVEKFIENGYFVIGGFNKNEKKAKALETRFKDRFFGVKADLKDENEVRALYYFTEKNFGHVDALILNAGVGLYKLFTETETAEWDEVFNVNVRSSFLLAKLCLPEMIRRERGKIVLVSSMWGKVGASMETAYSASKAALIGLTRALAKEVSPSGVTVNCVCPGVIKSEMNARFSAEDMKELASNTPVRKIGEPQDVAELVYYLASEKADFITGQDFSVDGGFGL